MSTECICGDCVEVMRGFPAESIDLVVTSPPYDNIRKYQTFNFDYNATLEQLYRVIRRGGVVVWITADQTIDGSETGTAFREALYAKEVGFNLHDTMIWNKGNAQYPETTRYYNVFEYMFILSKNKIGTTNLIADKKNKRAGETIHGTQREPDGSIKWQSGRVHGRCIKEYGVRNNVWDMPGEKHNTTSHPAVFPVNLARDHILTWSNPGDTVLDPFMGSGTTGVACVQTGRNFIGIEISRQYCDEARERIRKAEEEVLAASSVQT